jgi:hypothetical protein
MQWHPAWLHRLVTRSRLNDARHVLPCLLLSVPALRDTCPREYNLQTTSLPTCPPENFPHSLSAVTWPSPDELSLSRIPVLSSNSRLREAAMPPSTLTRQDHGQIRTQHHLAEQIRIEEAEGTSARVSQRYLSADSVTTVRSNSRRKESLFSAAWPR